MNPANPPNPVNPATPANPANPAPPELVAVLDMGASAIRLVIAEVAPGRAVRTIEEASRGVLLGRDTFSSGVIGSQTMDAALTALDKFRQLIDGYGIRHLRAVATSAVREARNGDVFLDRIQGRTGISFEIINEAEESRLVFLAARQSLGRTAAFRGAWTLLAEVGGGSTSLTLLRNGSPNRSGVYALGAVRARQQLNLRRLTHDVQLSLLKRSIANVIEEIRLEIPLRRVTHMVVLGGDVRFAASQILDTEGGGDHARVVTRDAFLAFCDQVERLDEEQLVDRFRLPAVEAETLMPSLLVYRTLLAETTARRLVVSDASLRTGVLLDLAAPGGRLSAEDFEGQVLASAEAVGHRYRFDRAHGRQVATLAMQLFDACQDDHGLSGRERLLLQVAALLHDIGIYVSLRAHHKHSQYLLASIQIFGLSNDETAIVSNIARYHRRGAPQLSHFPYAALDRRDRLIVNKLAAMLRVANALDAEHLQKVQGLRLVRHDPTWILEVDGIGDLTMEQLAATARTDMFSETFGRALTIRMTGVQP
ncbi:MAG TPA: Ppx/GppA phosphatase family protein [Vicinamibacterales bacterium]|nr:Ppx/GppA phosphatase family protein [Vicinamibacterales bacterium]